MKNNKIKLFIIEDEEFDVKRIYNTLQLFADRINVMEVVSSGRAALDWLKTNHNSCDVILMDYQISGGLFGEKLIQEIKRINPLLQIIIITKKTINQTDPQFANQLIESGASWFGTKYPVDIEEYIYQPTDFILSILNAYEKKQLQERHLHSQENLERNIQLIIDQKPMIGKSKKMQELRSQIQKYAQFDAHVLILGESGTGKELVASHLHYLSKRKFENFITVNCAAIPKDLIESELFGFEKGSFTGAGEEKAGLFEQADGGTIFLDEVIELPLSAQAKLLRVLQEGEIDKIGRKKKYHVDTRVIAATNRDIFELMDKKEFREDLFYRLNILQIKVPSLRERDGDILLLLDHLFENYSQEMGIKPPQITDSARKMLENYSWPGNIRQLKNVTYRMVIMAAGKITEAVVKECIDLDRQYGAFELKTTFNQKGYILPLKEMEREFRIAYLDYVRKACRTDSEAAQKLGLAPSNYYRLCKELGMK